MWAFSSETKVPMQIQSDDVSSKVSTASNCSISVGSIATKTEVQSEEKARARASRLNSANLQPTITLTRPTVLEAIALHLRRALRVTEWFYGMA